MKRQFLGRWPFRSWLSALACGRGKVHARLLLGGESRRLQPAAVRHRTTLDVVRPVYNRLVEFKFGTTEIMPSLAESWEISDDGLTYTFHLRKDVKFHSSKAFSRRAASRPTMWCKATTA